VARRGPQDFRVNPGLLDLKVWLVRAVRMAQLATPALLVQLGNRDRPVLTACPDRWVLKGRPVPKAKRARRAYRVIAARPVP